jgi:hypothetical protein
MIILPRQARDKHRESSTQKSVAFFAAINALHAEPDRELA